MGVPRGCSVNSAQGIVRCTLGNMPDDAVRSLRITVRPVRAGSVRLRGCSIISSTPDPNASNNSLGQSSSGQPQSRSTSSASPELPETDVVPTDNSGES